MTADMRPIEELFTVEQLMSNIKQTREKIDWLNTEISVLRETQGGGTWATDLIKAKSEAIADFEDVIESWLLLISIAPFSEQSPSKITYPAN